MPLYTFKCEKHGHRDFWLDVADRNRKIQCGACDRTLTRTFEMPAVKLKGTGFYTTDIGNLDKQRRQGRKLVESGEVRPNANLVE